DLWIADVGEESLEEVNRLGVDENFGKDINLGWPQYAGSTEYYIDEPSPTRLPPTPPSYEYDHREGRCAVIGGEVYRGGTLAEITGNYLFADLCGKALLGLREAPDGGYEEFTVATIEESQIVSVDAGNDGEVFVTSISGGVYRLVPA
ncbi:MAG: PQQ-dependent sugar dehydrogenase, partial [Acidimicrobiales bacterium]|nr:PQQ-dependent sugar dehydrogenase [Acidimicrobiales bacterium]